MFKSEDIYFTAERDVKYCDKYVCLTCLSARITRKPHRQTSSNFLCMLSMAAAQSSSDGIAMHYVLLVLWCTMEPMGGLPQTR